MLPKYKVTLVMLALMFSIVGCNKEGPFGNTPGPKKPSWNYDRLFGFMQQAGLPGIKCFAYQNPASTESIAKRLREVTIHH